MCAANNSSEDLLSLVPCEDSDKNHEKTLFNKVYEKAMKLFDYLPPVSDACKDVQASQERVQTILDSISADSDPEVSRKLEELQEEFRRFIRIGKEFLEECLTMAKYITIKDLVQKIKEELEVKMLDQLTIYTNTILSYLRDCSESFKEYEKTQRELKISVSESRENFHTQAKEAKQAATNAQDEYVEAVIQRTNSQGSSMLTEFCAKVIVAAAPTLSVATGSVASIAAAPASSIATGSVAPIAAGSLLVSGLSSLGLYLVRANEGANIADELKQEREKNEKAIQLKVIQDALKTVSKLYKLMSDASALIEDMDAVSGRVLKTFEREKGIKEYVDSNKVSNYYDVVNKIDRIYTAGIQIIRKIGEDGTHPISSNPDQLVSNTQPQQTTDTEDVSAVDAAMEAINLTGQQPNGRRGVPLHSQTLTEESVTFEEAAQESNCSVTTTSERI